MDHPRTPDPLPGEYLWPRRKWLQQFGTAALVTGISAVSRQARADESPPSELDASYIYDCPELIEITAPGPIIRPDGTSVCSWSRRPYLDLNFEDARFYSIPYFQRYRLKKWDMYHLATPDHYLSFLVAWIGYGAFGTAYVYDRKSKTGSEEFHLRLPRPENPMMRNSDQGRTEYLGRKGKIVFEVEGESRQIRVDFPSFAGVGLKAAIDLHLPAGHESVCATHLTNPRRSHYSHKINCMTARGELELGKKSFRLDPENSFGMLDFGRGYYPPKLFWYWATASGRDAKGKLVGWNLGYGNSPVQTNENALFYDGRLHKIGQVKCQVPEDLMQPWRVWSEDGRVDLTLVPENVRFSDLKIGGLYSIGRPALGLYSGAIILDSGEKISLPEIFGLFEWFNQKW